MAADVRSLAALRDWYGAVAVYMTEIDQALAAARAEVRRGQDWLGQQLDLWQKAVRQGHDDVVQAKNELAAKKFPDWSGKMPDTTIEERNLRRAMARLEHAEEKVQKCRQWLARLPKQIDEVFTGPAHKLQNLLEADLPRAQAVLGRQIDALERYSDIATDFTGGAAPSVTAPDKPAEGTA